MTKISTVKPLARPAGGTNDIVYIQLLPGQASVETLKPGCVVLDQETSKLVLKFQRPDAALDESVRLMNEIAAMDLARRALVSLNVVAKVFAYGKIEHKGQTVSWFIQEFKSGETLSAAWDGLSLTNKETLLTQIAQIYTTLQQCELPETVNAFGGLQFNDDGEIVSGPHVFGFGGPYASLEDLYVGMFKKQLELADSCSVVKGWSGSKKGLRQRIEKFVNEGLSPALAAVSNKTLTLVHGDFGKHQSFIVHCVLAKQQLTRHRPFQHAL